MAIDFKFSDEMFRKYIGNKVIGNRIALIISIALYILLAVLNKKGHGIARLGSKALTYGSIFLVIVLFAFGIAGFCISYGEHHDAEKCSLGMENGEITYMCNTRHRYLVGDSMRGWNMDIVTSVDEHKTYYLVKGKGVYVPDTRFMDRQRPVKSLKIPKWFVGMERLKQAEVK